MMLTFNRMYGILEIENLERGDAAWRIYFLRVVVLIILFNASAQATR